MRRKITTTLTTLGLAIAMTVGLAVPARAATVSIAVGNTTCTATRTSGSNSAAMRAVGCDEAQARIIWQDNHSQSRRYGAMVPRGLTSTVTSSNSMVIERAGRVIVGSQVSIWRAF